MANEVKFRFISFKILGIMGVVLLAFPLQGFCSSASGLIGRGNKSYRKKAFNKALADYKQASEKIPESDIANFNLGTAYYQVKDFAQAKSAFTKSLTTKEPLIEAKVNYNIANTVSRQAQLEENSDIAKSIKLYEEALQYYRRAIELDEKDPDAKFNYEFIEKRIEELRKQEQEQKDQQKQQDKQQQDKQQQDKKDKEQQQQQDQQPQQDPREQDSQDQPQDQEPDQQQDSGPSQEDEMSPEQARLLLEGHRQQEESDQKDKHKKALAYPHVLKDW